MLFHRIDYIDTHGFLSNLWRLDANSANTVAARLAQLGMMDVRIEPVHIPLGDPLQFKQWLNSNPNSPNLKDSTMQQTTYPSGVTVTTDGEHATMSLPAGDPRHAEMTKPLVWPEVSSGAPRAVGFRPELAAPYGEVKASALHTQVAGDHYKQHGIQPIEYIHANGLPFIEGNVVKYITRWRDKGGIKDLEKIKHYIDLLIELETRKEAA